jgi:uncharacterized protein (DUF433 family)
VRLDWSAEALHDLECAADWSRGQAEAVVNAMEWMADTGFLPRPADPGGDGELLAGPAARGDLPRGRSAVAPSAARCGQPAASATLVVTRITVDPDRMDGLPCIRDTRVTVTAVLGQLAAGQPVEQILLDYPYLEFEDIVAAVSVAAQSGAGAEL